MVRVAGEDDPRLERDVVAREAVRVAGAVEALVAAPHDAPDFGELLDRSEDARAEVGMRLDDRALVVGQRPGLREDRLRDPDLADVVEEGAELQALQRAWLQSELLADAEREIRDPPSVRGDVGVVRLQRVRQRLDRGHERALEPLVAHCALDGELRLLRQSAEELELPFAVRLRDAAQPRR